jgi:hypothetical protein
MEEKKALVKEEQADDDFLMPRRPKLGQGIGQHS